MKEVHQLRAENMKLKELLEQHGIQWQLEPEEARAEVSEKRLTSTEKVKLFKSLFRGRSDVFAQRWESMRGTSGYSPACANEWKPGVCRKPAVKCGKCNERELLPLTDEVVYDHLAGKHTVGIYPLFPDDTCRFLSVDFDGSDWKNDSRAFWKTCKEFGAPAYIEISRSGRGAHVWVFFSEPVPAVSARRLGTAIISRTCRSSCQLSLESYDRLFPNQNTMPRGGFGNLIALPLQKQPRQNSCSVFVNDSFEPIADQWKYLEAVQKLSPNEVESIAEKASEGRNPLDVSFIQDDEEAGKPWVRKKQATDVIPGEKPEYIDLVQADGLYIRKEGIPGPLRNRIVRLAAFQNPEFYKAQAMRLPVWNKPRLIGCAENCGEYVRLPRGCHADLKELLEKNGIELRLTDERVSGSRIRVRFAGKLRKDQKAALKEMLNNETGVLSAPTAFGKTVAAAALIARRKVSTLILVHRTDLMRQWEERLKTFLEGPDSAPGLLGGGKSKPTGRIDIAVLQSLTRTDELGSFLDCYGQVIVDECHHISAFSFESVLKESKARFITGLTATPVRRDGHQPIVFMQCGPVCHEAKRTKPVTGKMEVWPRTGFAGAIPPDTPVQEVFRILINNQERNRRIADDVLEAYEQGRKILVLTERTDHLQTLNELLKNKTENLFILHGRLSAKQRRTVIESLHQLEETAPRIILATGRLIGEGFDHPALDTLVLAMPISWKGTLQQYAGRLHRDHADKESIRIYDYTENNQPMLRRMWEKRLNGYKAIGYSIRGASELFDDD